MKTLGIILALVLALCAPARGQIAVSSGGGGGAAAPSRPTFVSAGAPPTDIPFNASQIVVAAPAGITTNDLIIGQLSFDGQNNASGFTASPGTWNLIRCDIGGNSISSTCLYWHIATGSGDGPWTFTTNNSLPDYIGARAVAFRGANTTTPINVNVGNEANVPTLSITSVALTPTVSNTLLVAFYTNLNFPSSGSTVDAALTSASNVAGANWVMPIGYTNAPASGVASGTYTSTFTGTPYNWTTETINIRP